MRLNGIRPTNPILSCPPDNEGLGVYGNHPDISDTDTILIRELYRLGEMGETH